MATGRFHRRRPRGVKRLIWAALVVSLAWSIGLIAFANTIPDTVADEVSRTDAIVVFTGGSGRLEAGLALLEQNLADQLFVSGVFPGVDVQVLLGVLRQSGEPLSDHVTIGRAVDTIGNAAETADWAEENGIHSIRLVTSGYHMPRSILEFREVMDSIRIVPHPVFSDNVKQDQWWRFPGTLVLIAGEYNKFLLAWARHRLNRLLDTWRALGEI